MARKLFFSRWRSGGLAVTEGAAPLVNVFRGTRTPTRWWAPTTATDPRRLAGNGDRSRPRRTRHRRTDEGKNDAVDGGPGFDRIFGGAGDDALTAGPARPSGAATGNDTIVGGTGRNVLHGGKGRRHRLPRAATRDRIWGAPGPTSRTAARQRRPARARSGRSDRHARLRPRRPRRRVAPCRRAGHDRQLRDRQDSSASRASR